MLEPTVARTAEVAPPASHPSRTRLTDSLRQEALERYKAGQSSRTIASELAISKTAVLKILKENGAEVRPVGTRY